MPIPIRLAAFGPFVAPRLNLVRDLEVHQLFQDPLRQGP